MNFNHISGVNKAILRVSWWYSSFHRLMVKIIKKRKHLKKIYEDVKIMIKKELNFEIVVIYKKIKPLNCEDIKHVNL